MLDPSKQRKGVTSFLGSVVGGAGSVMGGDGGRGRWGEGEMGVGLIHSNKSQSIKSLSDKVSRRFLRINI